MAKFLNVLTLIFIVAKLFGAITLSWWIIVLPTLLIVLFYVCVFTLLGLMVTVEERFKKR